MAFQDSLNLSHQERTMSKQTLYLLVTLFFAVPSIGKESCLYCHTDSSVTRIFDSTAHAKKKISCADCHVDRSQNDLEQLWRTVRTTFTFSYKNAHIADLPTSRTCLSCHEATGKFNVVAEAALPEKLKTIGLIIAHDKHMALMDSCKTCHKPGSFTKNKTLGLLSHSDPVGCIACHSNIAHVRPEKYGVPFPTEKGCGLCHNASNKCPSMKKIADIKDKSRCTECHPNQFSF
jgi:hypothetical protein